MRIFVLTANNELRVSRKIHLRDHPSGYVSMTFVTGSQQLSSFQSRRLAKPDGRHSQKSSRHNRAK
jgi:hypothetical protein